MHRQLITFIITLPLIVSCIPSVYEKPQPFSIASFVSGPETDRIPNEINRLRALADDTQGVAVPVDVHLKLALLYSSHRNDAPDYSAALSELELYMELFPAGAESEEILNLRSLLRAIEEGSDALNLKARIKELGRKRKGLESENVEFRSEIRRLKSEIEALRESKMKLSKENLKLNDTIEKLKILDMHLEEKRKNFR